VCIILFFSTTFLILRGDKRLGHLLVIAFVPAALAFSLAIAIAAILAGAIAPFV
jgi:hypothetical protein